MSAVVSKLDGLQLRSRWSAQRVRKEQIHKLVYGMQERNELFAELLHSLQGLEQRLAEAGFAKKTPARVGNSFKKDTGRYQVRAVSVWSHPDSAVAIRAELSVVIHTTSVTQGLAWATVSIVDDGAAGVLHGCEFRKTLLLADRANFSSAREWLQLVSAGLKKVEPALFTDSIERAITQLEKATTP
jgi:hypothetical protein